MDLSQKTEDEKLEIIGSLMNKGYIAHGSTEMFNDFQQEYIKGDNREEYGYGFYFCDEVYKPIAYGNYLYFTKQDIYNFCNLNGMKKNPLEGYEIGQNSEFYVDDLKQHYDYYKHIGTYYKRLFYYADMLKKYNELEPQEKQFLKIYNNYINEGNSPKKAYSATVGNRPNGVSTKYLSNLFLKLGYDGIIAGNQFVIFNFEKLNKNLLKIELNNYDEFMSNQIEEKRKEFKSILEKIENAKYGK